MNKILIIGAVVVVLGGIGWAVASQMNAGDSMTKDDTMMEKTGDTMMQKDAMGTTSDTMMKDDGAMMEGTGDTIMQ